MSAFVVQIETTNRCNARCTFCFRERMRRPQGLMPWDVFEKIVLENPSGIYDLCMHGEPLLDPLLEERVAYIRAVRPSAEVYFHTNGGLLTERRCVALKEAGLSRIVVSCYGEPEQHDRLQPPVKFERVKTMAAYMAKLMPVMVVSNLVETMDADRLRDFWAKLGCTFNAAPGFEWGPGDRSRVAFDAASQCPLIMDYRMFAWNGDFMTCCYDYENVNRFGNVLRETWEDGRKWLGSARCAFCTSCPARARFDAWRKA